jgi:metal-responsive CopG/Arc/MetJ family transcriptional regulator
VRLWLLQKLKNHLTKKLNQLDLLVKAHRFPNRSRAIQEAIAEKIGRIEKIRLARECGKLNPELEQ